MESAMEAQAIMDAQAYPPSPETKPALKLVTVPTEEEARQSISAFFKAVSNGQMETAKKHLEKVADYAQHSGDTDAVQDLLLTGFTAAAGIEGSREKTTSALGYAVHTPLKEQLTAFGKNM